MTIKELRRLKGISLQQIADALSISRQRVYQIQQGKDASDKSVERVKNYLKSIDDAKNYAKRLRFRKGLTVTAAAKQIGISVSTLRNFESAQRATGISTVKKIADFYGVEPAMLMDEMI